MAKDEAGRLRIGVGPATRLHPLPKLIEKAARAFPRLQFVTRFAGPNLMMRALRAGTFDLVFCNHQLTTPQDDSSASGCSRTATSSWRARTIQR